MSYSVTVKGTRDSLELVRRVERASRKMKNRVLDGIVDEIRDLIRSRSGRLAASWRGSITADGRLAVRSKGVRYARASVRGAYAEPGPGKRALHFADGRFAAYRVLRPGAYLGHPTSRGSYIGVALSRFGGIVKRAFGDSFSRI